VADQALSEASTAAVEGDWVGRAIQPDAMEKAIMPIAAVHFDTLKLRSFGLVSGIGLTLLVTTLAQSSFAQEPGQETFASAEEAGGALFTAAQHNDEQALLKILGGGNDFVSSGDANEDQQEREQFAEKYQEMHRLSQQTDGSDVLTIGAENWPFPAPLVLRNGRWYFDTNAGAQEVLFRRVGENEVAAIATCHALISTAEGRENGNISDDPVSQYAHSFVSAMTKTGGIAPADAQGVFAPFYGYYFRALPHQQSGWAFVAYPARYRSTGVMTFLVTDSGTVYEKDLGPDTAKVAATLVARKPDSSWHVAD
jgi:Protein of unknown function (DUF2950)